MRPPHGPVDTLGTPPGTPPGPYRAPRWLPGGHAQTIVPALAGWPAPVSYRRVRLEAPDGDFVDLDVSEGATPDAPLLLVFHGLEGHSRSRYSLALASHARAHGWACAIAHFRGCGGELNRAPRFYHSGDSAEIDWIVRRVQADHVRAAGGKPSPLYVAGISLGGNALLKWLAEQGSAATSLVQAAVAVSAPLDLAAGGASLSRGLNMIYTRMFLKTLKPKCLAKLEQHPGLFDRDAMLAARDLYEFDNVVTAPLHGFRDTDDYWARASAGPHLSGIAVPTLVLNARNDPFMPGTALPTVASAAVRLEYPEEGGHVGFVATAARGGNDWLPRRVFSWFTAGV